MRRLTAIVHILGLLALVAAMPTRAAESAFPDIQRILDAGVVRVAILNKDSPPMIMTAADGTPAGSEADMARDLAEKLGVDVQFIRTAPTYDDVIAQVAANEADLGISFLSSGVDRALHVLFSRPYIHQSARIFYNRSAFARLKRDYDIGSLSQIHGTPAVDAIDIGALEGSVYQGMLDRDFEGYHIKPFTSLDALMKAVRSGDTFAGVHGGLQIDFYMRQHSSTAIHVAVDPELRRPSEICIAVRPDAPNLLRWVDVYLTNNVGIEDAKELVEEYVAKKAAEEAEDDEEAAEPVEDAGLKELTD